MKKTLGIVSGMGALAGLRLADHLNTRAMQLGAVLDREFPSYLVYNLPAEGIDESGVVSPDIFHFQLRDVMCRMNEWPCDYAILACNSAYVFVEELQQHFRGKIINIVDAACDSLSKYTKCVGVISSQSTKNDGLYLKALERRGFKVVLTTDSEQVILNAAIKAVICGRQINSDCGGVERVMIEMDHRGADEIIVGCTELPLVIRQSRIAIQTIDAGYAAIDQAMTLLNE